METEIYEQIDDDRRIVVAPEEESYFDVYGEPEGYTDAEGIEHTAEEERNEIIASIDRDGIWWYCAERRCKCCGAWQHVDSIGMVIGDLRDSGYYDDLIAALYGGYTT